jgi:hypothetical protein
MRLLVRRISFRTWPFVGVFDRGALAAAATVDRRDAPVSLSLQWP